jgi:hypothetical protein
LKRQRREHQDPINAEKKMRRLHRGTYYRGTVSVAPEEAKNKTSIG